jgi:hypothetical protein
MTPIILRERNQSYGGETRQRYSTPGGGMIASGAGGL